MSNSKQQLIETIKSFFSTSLSKPDQAEFDIFVNEFLAYLAPKDLTYIHSETFAERIETYWQLCKNQKDNANIIDIFNSESAFPHGGKKMRYRTSFFLATPDMPFIVGTIFNALRSQGLELHVMLHSVINTKTTTFSETNSINCLYIESNRVTDPVQIEMLEEFLHEEISNNALVVADYQLMTNSINDICREYQTLPADKIALNTKESTDFLNWLMKRNFIFLGIRTLNYTGDTNQLIYHIDNQTLTGLFKNAHIHVLSHREAEQIMPQEFQDFANSQKCINVHKSHHKSTIHRAVAYDVLQIKRFNPQGKLIGEYEICGLFSSSYYTAPITTIPILRLNAKHALESLTLDNSRHNRRLFHHVVNHYPRDDMWKADTHLLAKDLMAIIEAETGVHSRLLVRIDPYERFISSNLYVPVETYSIGLINKAIALMETTFNASLRDKNFYIGDGRLARVKMSFKVFPGNIPNFSHEELEKQIIALTHPWHEDLYESLMETYDEDTVQNLYMCYMTAFPINYRDVVDLNRTISDIQMIESALADDDHLAIEIYSKSTNENLTWHLRMAQTDRDIVLSDILPKMESIGVKVLAENYYIVSPLGSAETMIHDFIIQLGDDSNKEIIDPATHKILETYFLETFREIWAGRFATDNFNELTLKAHLHYREIVLFRAISSYFRQSKMPFTPHRICECLMDYPDLTRDLVEYFHARFNPEKYSENHETQIEAKILARLENVRTLDEDRILRAHLIFIQAVVRTNFYQKTHDKTDPIFSFKISSRDLEFLPQPRPFREIFIYSERFEAVHLRFGLVARGGLRWSDRQDDFRTEILGLVKAQQVKNAVIVPVGSKGGFVLKKPQNDRESFMREGIACYKLFIQSMLDITDNLDGNVIVPPPNVIRKDHDDFYLVVAADKGTATFSDTANEIAIQHGFWLGDAFASGGSVGYDHKKMGITARGAWECVKRHFREIGTNIQTTTFNVVGIGDMSGDVFGNGMLLSKKIRLRVAFNHLHIFIDPDPDPEKSWNERKRLFDLPRSNWSDYDPQILSKGAQIFERSAKNLQLNPEIKTLLELDQDHITPNALLQAILKSKTDLLWFGGIGTYLKATAETHADAGDKANDDIRIDAKKLQALVIGEGANLGVTHRARIEYASNGGRCNTDAVDNSAGVDCSDHEVNLKILLTQAINANKLKTEDRNHLLETMTDDVAELVLNNNYQQGQTLSLIQRRNTDFIDEQQQLIRDLVNQGLLNRGLEFLPRDEEIEARREQHLGFYRPELCVLLAYAKNVAYQEILDSNLPDDPFYVDILYHYFPKRLTTMFGQIIETHCLKREIIATVLTNQIINFTRPSFINALKNKTGADITDIVRSFSTVIKIFNLESLRKNIESLDNQIPTNLQLDMIFETYRTTERITEWFIQHEKSPLQLENLNQKYGENITRLEIALEAILPPELKKAHTLRVQRYSNDLVDKDLSHQIACLKIISSGCEIIQIAEKMALDVQKIAEYYFLLSERFSIDWLRSQVTLLIDGSNRWEKQALNAVSDDLWHFQSELTQFIVKHYAKEYDNVPDTMEAFFDKANKTVQIVDNLLKDCRKQSLSLALLTVVLRALKTLLIVK